MKKTIIPFLALALLAACNNDKKETTTAGESTEKNAGLTVNDDEGKTGTFTAAGVSFKGKSSTQYFGDKTTGQYSVLCQQDEPFALLQAIFANEQNASGSLKPSASFTSIEPGTANIALSGTAIGDKEFVTKSNSAGSITVEGKKLIIKDLELFNQDNAKKTVSAEIDF